MPRPSTRSTIDSVATCIGDKPKLLTTSLLQTCLINVAADRWMDNLSYGAADIQLNSLLVLLADPVWSFLASSTSWVNWISKANFHFLSLLQGHLRAFGGVAPPKSSIGDENWFPSHLKVKYLTVAEAEFSWSTRCQYDCYALWKKTVGP